MTEVIEIEGLEEALRKMSPELLAGPVRKLLTNACLLIEGDARKNAPVDTGRLRASITHKVDDAEVPLEAIVGSNVEYAPYMEYGTGLLAEGDPALKRGEGPHWPPGDALSLWAKRHGFASGAQVAAIIGRRGGLAPRRYLRNAFESNEGRIPGLVETCLAEIAAAWGKRG